MLTQKLWIEVPPVTFCRCRGKVIITNIARHAFIIETSDSGTKTRFRTFVEFLAGTPRFGGDGGIKVVRFEDSQPYPLYLEVSGSKDVAFLLHLRLLEAFPELQVQRVA